MLHFSWFMLRGTRNMLVGSMDKVQCRTEALH